MADRTQHPANDRLDALLATLDVVEAVLDHVEHVHHRAALLDLVLIDHRAYRTVVQP